MQTTALPQNIETIKKSGLKYIQEKSLAAAAVRTRQMLAVDRVTSKKAFTEENKVVYAFYKPGNTDPDSVVFAIF